MELTPKQAQMKALLAEAQMTGKVTPEESYVYFTTVILGQQLPRHVTCRLGPNREDEMILKVRGILDDLRRNGRVA